MGHFPQWFLNHANGVDTCHDLQELYTSSTVYRTKTRHLFRRTMTRESAEDAPRRGEGPQGLLKSREEREKREKVQVMRGKVQRGLWFNEVGSCKKVLRWGGSKCGRKTKNKEALQVSGMDTQGLRKKIFSMKKSFETVPRMGKI